jgi:branched-chain amino acid aminotransferase
MLSALKASHHMSLLWINGTLVEKNQARVSPFDHGFLYGDGVWEPLRIFNGKLFHPGEHLQNLFHSAAKLHIEIPHTEADLLGAIETTLKANERIDGYVRVIVTRGPGTLGPDPRKIDPQVIIIAEEYLPFPSELYNHGLHVVSFPTAIDSDHPLVLARTLAQPYIPLAKHHALQGGCLEAIITNSKGDVFGTTEGVLFLVRDGAVFFGRGQRPDVTGNRVAGLAGEIGLIVAECRIQMPELFVAEEVFQAGTACGVIGIVRVDGKPIGAGNEGPVTRTIREAFARLTKG